MSGTMRTKLGFETLERKQMLAGDVLVSLVEGRLMVEGDDAANQIVITSGDEAGTLVIQGVDGTNVKFADAEPIDPPTPATGLVIEDVRGHVHVDLGAGDDSVTVHDAQFRRGLTIDTGAGADTVRIGLADDAVGTDEGANVTVRGSLFVRTGSENDTVGVGSAKVGGVLGIATGGGDDAVNLGAEEAATQAADVGAGDPATLQAKWGVDVLLGEGTDSATLRDVSTRAQIVVGGGEGADTIGIHDVTTGFLAVRGGSGVAVDQAMLSSVKARHAAIELGDGADQASIIDSAFSSLSVALGGGNDTLSIEAVKAARALSAGGEGDGDTINDAGDNTIMHKAVAGFEIPPDVNTDPPFPRPGNRGNLGGSIGRLLGRLRR
jgi:hypothetical protein